MTMLLTMAMSANAEWQAISSQKPAPADIQLLNNDASSTTLLFTVPGFSIYEVEIEGQVHHIIGADETSPLLAAGAPDLLKMTAPVIIPDVDEMSLEVIRFSYRDYEQLRIAPSKGNLTRDIDPASVPYTFGPEYAENAFYPGTVAGLGEPYIIRDLRGQTVIAFPFQYNPVTRVLRVYEEIEVRVSSTGKQGVNPLIRKSDFLTVEPEFRALYDNHFLNWDVTDYTPVDEEGCMLIISYGSFMADMQPFVDWKKTIGRQVEMVNVSTIGNSSAIKTYIANYYNSHDLAYVLLVGDAAQVPTSYASGDSDNNYAYIVGSDHYPDIFIGRFSAENATHVQTQVQRTIGYEQNPYTGYDWYTKNIGIASSQGPGDDNEYDYQHVRNMQTDLMAYGHTWNYELFDGSQGGHDAAGNPTPTMVAADINTGGSIILYCGHGSTTSWGTSGFSNTNVAALSNMNMLPFIWSVACVNGNFVGSTCFAEAWLRSTNGGQPIGAVATLMSTINQSWNPPMDGQDDMVDILVESYANNIKRTFGGLSMNGCMKMNDTYGSQGWEITDTWTIFGDPSVMVRSLFPQSLTVTHDPVIFIGADQFTVYCNEEGALVALTINNEILATAYVTGGAANLSFSPLSNTGMMKIAVTAYNHIPYIAEIQITPASGPYLNYESHTINDPSGNNNGLADWGEDITLDLTIRNVGSDPAYNVTATITTFDPYVTITDGSQPFGTVPAGASVTQNDAFAITIDDMVPDMHVVTFDLTMNGDAEISWNSMFTITLHAPVLEAGIMTIDDASGGNGNGMLDPGETVQLTIATSNTGSSQSPSGTAQLTTTSPWLTIVSGSATLPQIAPGGNANPSFQVSVDAATPVGTSVDLIYNAAAGGYTASHTYFQSVGLVLEDWETGDLSKFPWETGGGAGWTVVNESPWEGTYCAKSGAIGDNQASSLAILMNVTASGNITFYRKVSSETNYDYLRFYIDGAQQGSWSGTMGWAQVSYPVTAGVHIFEWKYTKDANTSTGSDCGWVDYIVFPPVGPMTPTATPYTTDFDLGGALPSGWYNGMSDDMDWTVHSGSTPSSNTGPSGDHTTGSGYYVYTESSSPNYPNKVAHLLSPVFDMGTLSDAQLSFWYHMYGTGMGSLHVDVYHNNVWINDITPAISGNQGNQWLQRTVDLSAYAGQQVQIRFRGITGSSYTSDMAIDDFEITGTQFTGIQIDLKAFLCGPYTGPEMYTFLNNYGYLPLSQPYTMTPFNYNGTESVSAIPNSNVVDWVLVELRETSGDASTATISTRIARQAGFILKNGTVVAIDGVSPLSFSLTITQNLYVVIWHRNHLGVMSDSPLVPAGNMYAWDFSTGANQAYSGTTAHKEMAPGVWGMVSGDGDSDGQITTGDKIEVWIGQSGMSGYLQGDFNLNGNVDNGDKVEEWAANAGMGCQVP